MGSTWAKILSASIHHAPKKKEFHRSYKKGEHLTQDEEDYITKYAEQGPSCPDCQWGRLQEGPSGGGSINYHCDHCGTGLCLGAIGFQRITDPGRQSPA